MAALCKDSPIAAWGNGTNGHAKQRKTNLGLSKRRGPMLQARPWSRMVSPSMNYSMHKRSSIELSLGRAYVYPTLSEFRTRAAGRSTLLRTCAQSALNATETAQVLKNLLAVAFKHCQTQALLSGPNKDLHLAIYTSKPEPYLVLCGMTETAETMM